MALDGFASGTERINLANERIGVYFALSSILGGFVREFSWRTLALALNENCSHVDSMLLFHSVDLQFSLASIQVTLRPGRKRLGPDARDILMRALTESLLVGLRMRILAEMAVFCISGHLTLTVCDAHSQFSVMPLLKLSPCGTESPWM